ncbi:MAG: type II toxin-antitoxin system HicB family antitoxin [Magnetococcales bacterium]|nr:type II toxin-antitoxin system HicB family antitoxin [Magnetococcales bacterium]MBF0435792.1 type II toxin-antitoxin system HicB family antitoxin [Magnetococcales bacterium]
MDIRYPAILEPQKPKGFFVRFQDLDDTFTEGETEEEALFNAAEVLTAMLEWRMDNNQTIPEPSIGVVGARYVAPDAKTQAALLVRRSRGDRPMSEIARAMGTSWPAANRMENVRHWPSLKQLEKTAAVLGHRLIISFE